MIAPTIGRVVWYRPSTWDINEDHMQVYDPNQPLDAHIVFVHSETLVNLVVFDHRGRSHVRSSVQINMGGIPAPYAEWMPYQIGQAKKHEEEKK